MSEIYSRKLLWLVIATCVCSVQAQSVSIKPDRFREGDGKPREVTVKANVTPGASLSIAVSYRSEPSASQTSFISRFSVKDNAGEDKNPQDGKICLVLPRAFDQTGVYIIEVDEPRTIYRFVHEPNNTSYFRQFVDWLVGAAGSGTRDGGQSALERIEKVTEKKTQDTFAIWMSPMPAPGQTIDEKSLKPLIRSAVTPSWSRNGNYLVCSAWRNGKWILTAFTINRAGAATQLWQWAPRVNGTSDFSPAWSPNGDAIAFVRLDQNQKSDILILQLDKTRRPRKELKVTDIGNVQAVLGWDKDLGLIFETKKENLNQLGSRPVWATQISTGATTPKVQPIPVSDSYSLVIASAPLRRTVIYAQESIKPRSVLYEMDSTGKKESLLLHDKCVNRWPTVSYDERWLVFESDCPLR